MLCGTVTVAVAMSGCAKMRPSVDHSGPFEEMRTKLEDRTSLEVEWARDDEAREQIRREVARILAEEPFTADNAVRVALFNNPRLRAQFEEIGVAHATVVQASLLSNPRASLAVKFPDTSPYRPRIELPYIQNIVDLYLIPLRRRVAKDMLIQAMLRTSDAVLSLGEDVRIAYFELAAAHRILEVEQQALATANAAAADARRLVKAGMITETDHRRALAAEQAQRLRVALAQIDVQAKRETLRELMGLTATSLTWSHPPELGPLPETECDLSILESKGLENRFDIELARHDMQLVDHAASLTRRSLFPIVNLGIVIERDRDRTLLVGPKLAVEIPVFDQKQGEIARLQAQARQSRELYEAQVDRALAEIRTLRAQYVGARSTAEFYRDVVVPLRSDVSETAARRQREAAGTIDELMLVRDEELRARLGYIEALRDYWISRARLERASACSLDSIPEPGQPMSWLRWAPDEFAGFGAILVVDDEDAISQAEALALRPQVSGVTPGDTGEVPIPGALRD